MSGLSELRLGFIPLTDCAPLIAAQAQGFFEDEGLAVELVREASWAGSSSSPVAQAFSVQPSSLGNFVIDLQAGLKA